MRGRSSIIERIGGWLIDLREALRAMRFPPPEPPGFRADPPGQDFNEEYYHTLENPDTPQI